MSLLAPLMLLGLLGLTLPLLAHLRGKEQPRVVRFAGLRFLAASDVVVTHRRSVRDLLLLLLRLALLALIVLALTRPVSTGDARLLVVKPWDRNMITPIEKAINAQNLGLNPQSDGVVIRLAIPPLTEERRRGLVKQVKEITEEAKKAGKGAGLLGGAGFAGYFLLLFASLTLMFVLDELLPIWAAAGIVALLYAIAAAVAAFGAGRVGVVGPHPEATPDWYADAGLDVPRTTAADLGHDLLDEVLR